jgi:hypothetical protein
MKSETTQAASRCTEQRAYKRPKRAGDCPDLAGAFTPRADGTFSPRITWCCRKRARESFRLQDWRCVGLDHPKCPKRRLDRQREAGERG